MIAERLNEIAATCEARAIIATGYATEARLGGPTSVNWIAEAAHYATVGQFLRQQAIAAALKD